MGHRRRVIGLTGNIATGKTTVVNMLKELGADVLDADSLAHAMMGPNSVLASKIEQRFGAQAVNADCSINRKAIGDVVFADPEALADLEAMIHPEVVGRMVAAICEDGAPVLVLDAIKLFEAGIAEHCDVIWVVDANRETRIKRVMERNGLSRSEAEQRVNAQAPQEEKLAKADVIIDNGGSIEATREQVIAAWQRLED